MRYVKNDILDTIFKTLKVVCDYNEKVEPDYSYWCVDERGSVFRIKEEHIIGLTGRDTFKKEYEDGETENFKRVGDWVTYKGDNSAVHIRKIEARTILWEKTFVQKGFGMRGCVEIGKDNVIILRHELGGVMVDSTSGVVQGAPDIVFEKGTVEELLVILQ